MIVTEKMAAEALIVLASHAGYGPGNGLAQMNAESAKQMYRDAARRAHPDAGGTAEDFAAVDRAKHVLLEWLKKEPVARPIHKPEVCPRCDGRGFIVRQHAWKAMRMQCPRCRGAGDLDTEHGGNDYDRTSS